MFKVSLKCVASTFDTQNYKQFWVSDGTKSFYSPLNYALQSNDGNLKLAAAKFLGQKLGLEWQTLKPSFCGIAKVEDEIEIIFYTKLPPDFNPPEKYELITGLVAKESEYVRKVEVFI